MTKIPQSLLKRLNRNLNQRHEVYQYIKNIEHFDAKVYRTLDLLQSHFPPYPFYRQPLKLFFTHGLTTVATLALFPPAPEVPPIAIPIVFAASFCVAYALTALRIV